MPKKDVESSPEELEELTRFDKIKKYGKENWKPLAIGAGAAVVTIGVIIVTKRVFIPRHLPYMSLDGTSTFVSNTFVKKVGTMFNVYNLSADGIRKPGGLSWMVKCVETGNTFPTQELAAKMMNLSKDHISNHLNGSRAHVNGYHFVRVGIGR